MGPMAFLLKTSSRTPSLVLHTALSILPSLVTDMTAVRLSDQTTVICLTAASASISSMRALSVSSSASSTSELVSSSLTKAFKMFPVGAKPSVSLFGCGFASPASFCNSSKALTRKCQLTSSFRSSLPNCTKSCSGSFSSSLPPVGSHLSDNCCRGIHGGVGRLDQSANLLNFPESKYQNLREGMPNN